MAVVVSTSIVSTAFPGDTRIYTSGDIGSPIQDSRRTRLHLDKCLFTLPLDDRLLHTNFS
jgi:hypothetical protein